MRHAAAAQRHLRLLLSARPPGSSRAIAHHRAPSRPRQRRPCSERIDRHFDRDRLDGVRSSDRALSPRVAGASSTQVSPGESLTVESAAAGCELGYLNGATYSIVLISASGERSAAVEVPVERDGSFSAEILVPETFPTGEASALVSGSSYDECGDDPGSCAVYSVDVVIES